ncbi:MAG TPA: CsbD family protein [Planctomycetaceae bacterium]|jgi:uncharacterized protein YjbJ (UPF0337 family)
MVNQQVLQGNWNEIKGKLRSKWGQLTTDDVERFDGNVDRLVGLIQRKTGEGRESIDRFLNEVSRQGASGVAAATQTVKDYAQQAGDKIQEGASQAADSFREGYDSLEEGLEQSEELVRRHPMESTAVCFGAGILTGLIVALMIHKK